MTALLVIEEGDLDHVIEVTEEDSKVGESSLNIRPGDQFTRREGALWAHAEKRERRGPRARPR